MINLTTLGTAFLPALSVPGETAGAQGLNFHSVPWLLWPMALMAHGSYGPWLLWPMTPIAVAPKTMPLDWSRGWGPISEKTIRWGNKARFPCS
jgi:hypothetical protein